MFTQWPQGCNLGEKPATETDGAPATPVSPDTMPVSPWGTLQLPHPDIINGKETRPSVKGNFSSVNRKVLLIRPNEGESAGVYEIFQFLNYWKASRLPAVQVSAEPWGPCPAIARPSGGLRALALSVLCVLGADQPLQTHGSDRGGTPGPGPSSSSRAG